MTRALALTAGLLFGSTAAFAQQAEPAAPLGGSTAGAGSKSMGDLVSEGYEIKSSVSSGTKLIVFMQKDKSAYACEFVTVTRSRCGSVN